MTLLVTHPVQAQKSALNILGSPAIRLNPSFSSSLDDVARDSDDTTILRWGGGHAKSKISVSTFCPGQKFTLFVKASNLSRGTASGRRELRDGMSDVDLIYNISKGKKGTASLVYETEVRLEAGSTETDFADIHSVTYTFTDQ